MTNGVTHALKIKAMFYHRIEHGTKTFEVRLNDRDYQVGDYISYKVKDNDYTVIFDPPERYQIIYVHTILGMQENYVVLGIKKVSEK